MSNFRELGQWPLSPSTLTPGLSLNFLGAVMWILSFDVSLIFLHQ